MDVAYLAQVALVIVPIGAAAFVVGRNLRQSGARGSIVWGLGVVVTAWGAAVVLEHAWDGLRFGVAMPTFLSLSLNSPVFDPLPYCRRDSLAPPWILWRAAPRGSVAWGAGVASLARRRHRRRPDRPDGAGPSGAVPWSLGVAAYRDRSDRTVRFRSKNSTHVPRPGTDAACENGTCEAHGRGIDGRNVFGQPLWTFRSTTHWCWNGEEVWQRTPRPHPRNGAYGDSHSPFWSSGFARQCVGR